MTENKVAPPVLENILVGPPPKNPEIQFEASPKRVRAYVGGVAIVDSTRVMLMLETSRLPVYYFPIEDVRADTLSASSTIVTSTFKGDASYLSILVDGRVVEDAAWRYLEGIPGRPEVSGYVAFHWSKIDAWLEEDEEVFAHARDPYHRIDILQSSRHVRIVFGAEVVAETRRARFLFETSLPTRYYIPEQDVRMDLLRPSPMRTRCAYKGQTSAYWQAETARGVRDVAWTYAQPTVEASPIAGMIAFFNERADAVFVDGVEQPPRWTPWS
ncbi:MAG: DUF427 domain-containing protein [Candidatus Dormibacteraeota bacterium]|nr:DUF427 domain-containing protein [Candidatus Dormibacteraeota bacterium]